MKIIVPKKHETYEKYINRILSSRPNIKDESVYQEEHHIIPRCLNGSDNKDNLIYLYGQEHYYAHWLLFKENENNYKLRHAWIMMAFKTKNGNMEREYEVTADEYALAKQLNAQETSKRFKGVKQSEESVRKRVAKTTGEGNGMYGRTGPLNPAYGVQHFGEENPFYGKHHTQETKDKISQKKKGLHKGSKNPSAKAVVCINTGEIFLTIQEAAIYGGTNHYGSNIVKCCKGKGQTCGKHPKTGEKLKWRYATEEEIQEKRNSLINP